MHPKSFVSNFWGAVQGSQKRNELCTNAFSIFILA